MDVFDSHWTHNVNLNVYLRIAILISIVSVSLGITMSISMQKVNSPLFTMEPIGMAFTLESPIGCGQKCLQHKDLCFAFGYNSFKSNCTLGSWIVIQMLAKSDPGTEFYSSGSYCDTRDNFMVVKNLTVTACLSFSMQKLGFYQARTSCQERGAYLYTMKSIEKLYLLVGYLTSNTINDTEWIGLDDSQQQNHFKWSDDGSELVEPLRSQLFAPFQPNDYKQEQDCVVLSFSIFPLNDCNCSLPFYFICERNLK